MSAGRNGDGAAEPLIQRESEDEGVGDVFAGNGRDDAGYEEEGEGEDASSFGWFIWILTFSAGVSGLLFGYEYVYMACFVHIDQSLNTWLVVLASYPPLSSPSAATYPLITRH
jgi:hypothetical protein